ncbi:MAG: hypothetical protein H7Z75_05525 [Ferruginibacter sp.]|nr:hypothetical protein [Cytophagales bacterium]
MIGKVLLVISAWPAAGTLLMVAFGSLPAAYAQKRVGSVSLSFQPQANEHVQSALLRNNELVVFSVRVDTKRRQSTLRGYGFDPQGGTLRWSRNLDSVKVDPWLAVAGKGTVAQSFDNAVASGLRGDQAVPLDYQYYLSFSPDAGRILAYVYDYSRKNLLARALLFDGEVGLLHRESLPIDNRTVNHGLGVNQEGDVFILNSNPEGDLQLEVGNLQTAERSLLEVPGGSGARQQFLLQFIPGEAWVMNTVGNAALPQGTMFTRFDLKSKTTVQAEYLPLPESVKAAVADGGGFLELTGCRVNFRKEVSMLLEKRNLLSASYAYQPHAVNNPANWRARKAVVQTGNAAVLTYDTLGVVLDERVIRRNEKVNAEEVPNDFSYAVFPRPGLDQELTTEGRVIRLEARKGTFQLNTYLNSY